MISDLTRRLANRTLTALKAEDDALGDYGRTPAINALPFVCFPTASPGEVQIVSRGHFIELALRLQQ